jgi:hypothetical protein
LLLEGPDNVDTISIAQLIPEQDNVVASARKFVGQMPAGNRVEFGYLGVRPVSRQVMVQQAAELGLPIDNHESDAH